MARFLLHGVPWWTYVAMRDALDGSVKMTYLRGSLELMSPSTLHADAKTIIARLLETWATERDVDLRGLGGATFRREANERGLEPDECYNLGPLDEDDVPNTAIQVIISSSRTHCSTSTRFTRGLASRKYGCGGPPDRSSCSRSS